MEKQIVDGVAEIALDRHADVIIAETTDKDVEILTTGEPVDVFKQISTSINPTKSRELDDRWLYLDTINWKTSDALNASLLDYNLPFNAIRDNPSSPNVALFLQHRLWRGDLRLKFVMNSSQFNVGQLIVYWYYADAYDRGSNLRKNFYSGVQLPHVFISACSSNDVELFIPFKSFKSYLSTMKRADDADPLALGSLGIAVSAPLIVAAGSSGTVDIAMFVSFENSEFCGLVDREIVIQSYKLPEVEAQMMPIKKIVNTTSDVLDVIYPDPNRDKPPGTVQYNQIIPMATANWASGTNDVDHLFGMRLDPLTQTPHPPGSCNVTDETLFSDIKTRIGFLRQLTWKDEHVSGFVLGKFLACPDKPIKDFPSVKVSGDPVYYLPPCSMLTSMNCYWRGDLKFTFDVIANASHKGSILISYIPGATDDLKVTQNYLKNSMCATFKLDGRTRFEFIVPYVSDKPWWSTSETFANNERIVLPPGVLYVSVLNRLNIMNAVSKSININVYLSAESNFEVAVPTPSRHVTLYNSEMSPVSKRNLYPKKGYGDEIGFGGWRYVVGGSGILRYGNGSDHITQWEGNMVPFGIYEIDESKSTVDPIKVAYRVNGKSFSGYLKYFCRIIVNGDRDTYTYMTAFVGLQQAIDYVWSWRKSSQGDPLADSPQARLMIIEHDTEYLKGTLILKIKGLGVEPQMDVDATFSFSDGANFTGDGRLTFGEQFTNLLDYCRRYQPYCAQSFQSNIMTHDEIAKLQCKIPIFPIGLELKHLLDMDRQAMGGLIPLVLAAYRFYRGGLRFRMIVNSTEDVFIFVQHRMDEIATSRKIIKVVNENDHFDTLESGYAQTFCASKINPVVTFEIPFYNNGILALLQEPDFDSISELQHYSMGYLSISAQSCKPATVSIQLYYSVADDFKMSHFIGFGPVRPIKDVLTEFESELRDEKTSSEQLFLKQIDEFVDEPAVVHSRAKVVDIVKTLLSAIPDEIFVQITESETYSEEEPLHEDDVVEAQGFDNFWKKKVKEEVVKEVIENKATIIEALHTFMEPFLERFSNAVSDLRGKISTMIANLGHMLISQDWKNLLWGTMSIIEVTGIIKSKYLDRVYQALSSMWETVFKKVTENDSCATPEFEVEVGEEVQAQSNFTKEELESNAACFSTILAVLVSSLDLTITKVSTGSFLSEKKSFADLFRTNVSTSNGLFVFFKNTLNWMFELYKKIKFRFSKLPQLHYMLAEESKQMQEWYDDCMHLTVNCTEQDIVGDPTLNVKVMFCAAIAEVIQKKTVMSEWSHGASDKEFFKFKNLTLSMCKKILQLKHDLVKYSQMSLVRYEPFVVSHEGAAGVGKSFLTNKLVKEMLNGIEWKGVGETSITRTPGNKYWNGLRAQPVCIYDDFLAIQEGENSLVDISELITLKSCAIFNPPQAAVDDKYIRYNPKIVVLNTNAPYAQIAGLASQDPWRRRRDALVHVRKLKQYENVNVQDIDRTILRGFGHLEFAFRKNKLKEDQVDPYEKFRIPDSDGNLVEKTWLNYVEYVLEITKRFVKYDTIELINYKDRLADELSFKIRDDETIRELIERYSVFMGSLVDKRISNQEQFMARLGNDVGELLYGEDSIRAGEMGRMVTGALMAYDREDKSDAIVKAFLKDNAVVQPNVQQQRLVNEMLNKFRELFRGTTRECMNFFSSEKDEVRAEGLLNLVKGMVGYVEDQIDPEMAGPTVPFVPAVKLEDYDCPHHYLFKNIDQYIYESDLKKAAVNSDLDQATCKWLFERYGTEVFMKIPFVEALAMDSTMLSLQQIVQNDVHVLVSSKKCAVGCSFDTPIRPDFTMEQAFWRNLVRNKNVRYQQVPVELRSSINPGDIQVGDRYDPRQETFRKVIDKLKEIGTDLFFGAVGTIVKMALQLLGFSATMFVMGKYIIPAVVPGPKPKPPGAGKMPQMSVYNDYVPKAHARRGISMRNPIKAQMNEVTTQNLVNLIKKNTFFIRMSYDEQEVSMRCVGIKNYMFIMVDHYHDYIVNMYKNFPHSEIKMDLVFDGIVIPFSYADLKFIHFEQSALVCGLLPRSIGKQFKNLVKHMPDAESVSFGSNFGKLIECDSYDVDVHETRIKRIDSVIVNPDVAEAGKTFVDTVWQHTFSRKGLCGSVLINDNNVTKPLLGIHIAGIKKKNIGYCEAVVSDTFVNAELMFDLGECSSYQFAEPEVVGQSVSLSIPSNVEELGSVGLDMACRPPEKSKLVESPCYQQFGVSTYAPPIMHPKDPRLDSTNKFSPLLSACVYHGYIPRPFESKFFDRALEEFRNVIFSAVKPLRPEHRGVCGVDEAVIGNPEFEIQSMELNTSEGFPYTKMRPGKEKDKTWLVEVENVGPRCVLRSIHPCLQAIMDEKMIQRKNGIVPVTIFTDCLKDAKLPQEKIFQPGKTRVFSLSPTDFTIQFRQYFLDYMCAYQNARFNADHAIGIDVESSEWNEMVLLLHANSHCIVVGDYKKFGPTLMKKCVDACFEIIIEWYELYYATIEGDSTVRRIMGMEISNAYHLMIDNLYKTYCGAPSGSPITTILNSMVNSLYIRTAWNAILPTESFDKCVKMISYGDDIIMSVKREIVDVFNCNSLANFFSNYEIVFTDAKKTADGDGKFVPYGSIEDDTTTFLKNTFVKHPFRNMYISKLDEQSINEIGNWIMKSPTPYDVAKDACSMYVRKSFPYGREEYQKRRLQVIKFWTLKGEQLHIPTWDCVDQEMYGEQIVNVFRMKKK